jgi:hypothetical protein
MDRPRSMVVFRPAHAARTVASIPYTFLIKRKEFAKPRENT